jgi:hypothetical protein
LAHSVLFDPLDGGLDKLGRAHLALAHKFRQSNGVMACIFSNRHLQAHLHFSVRKRAASIILQQSFRKRT